MENDEVVSSSAHGTIVVPESTGELDSVLDLEISFQREGADLASETGARFGINDGRALGWASGASVSAEMAFYAGVAAALQTIDLSPRARAAAEKLDDVSRAVKVHVVGNSENVNFEALLVDARSTFRNAMALAGLQRVRFDADKPSKMADYSF